MTKVDKIGIILAISGLLVSVFAWQFPVSGEVKNTPPAVLTFQEKNSDINSKSIAEPLEFMVSVSSVSESSSPLGKEVRKLEFSEFLYQFKTFSLDSGKLGYVQKSKHVLSNKLKFSELNVLLGELNMDSNKIALVSMLENHFEPPKENDLVNYTNSFILDSNRQKALSLIYQ
ncbi:DUF4476 domain-containing protein [Cellvibrio sp. pealriver]|uniref:DUF4476 domain-containing protein n=1 Tax=Cellvibrio sp. pealriver TaxID=1622269 RepID=UPI00066FCBE9|nr:DUF4476 domain-containing protein [Cellvibrio sp. pealriver]